MILIKSNYDRQFGFFSPTKFERRNWKRTDKYLCFYFINDNQELIICEKSKNPWFSSDDRYFILIYEMNIENDRNQDDYACLYKSVWSGM